MKSMIYQFYNEGFATTFCAKPINYINKKVKGTKLVSILTILIKIIYTLIVILLLSLYIYIKFFR